ncbi:MAG: radical SAM protein [Chloroflexi bacterium]|nr:radical SAM protein [Chloroflexota bacterium]
MNVGADSGHSDRAWPVYRELLNGGRLADRVKHAAAAVHDCHLCGNDCGIDRTEGSGPCRIADVVYVASYGPHHGEESVLRGWRGSGTIFFSGCNLHCVYCQNHDISQHRMGSPVTAGDLAAMMLWLEEQGCHNINLVSPTHVAAHIVPSLVLAVQAGLMAPIVYNTGGYDGSQALELMNGLVDIYMPDAKYSDAKVAQRLSSVDDYPAVNRAALREMHQQVGDLQIDGRGLARRGLLVRHLVLPGGLAGTTDVTRFLARELSIDTYVNLMAQYRPAYHARHCVDADTPLARPVTSDEYQEAYRAARRAGLHRFDEAHARLWR